VERRRISSGSPYEPMFGFSRAVVAGDRVFVSGTAPTMPDGGAPPADAYGQVRRCFEITFAALEEAGAQPGDVVRTRVFFTESGDFDDIARAHGQTFGEIRPASTAVIVAGLVDPRWRVEIEADAVLPDRSR
jgi:enamine deaminase RidA (YjgF/YER057c/UK114 family)